MTDAEIPGEVLVIVGGAKKLVGLPDAVPLFFCEGHVSALGHIVVHGDDIERSGVRGSVAVRKILEPGNETCALRDFVRDLSVITLILADELQCRSRGSEIARGVEREG